MIKKKSILKLLMVIREITKKSDLTKKDAKAIEAAIKKIENAMAIVELKRKKNEVTHSKSESRIRQIILDSLGFILGLLFKDEFAKFANWLKDLRL